MDINEGKEILTLPIIRKELLKINMCDTILLVIAIPILAFVLWLIPIFFERTTLYPIITKVCIVLFLLFLIFASIELTRFTIKLVRGQFTIKKAVLYKKEESKGSKRHGYVPPKLFFDRCGDYNVSDYRYYVWSHAYCMLPHELFET